MKDNYDAAIVGGALTGTVLYLALADLFIKHKKSLVILEQAGAAAAAPADNRMLSLGYASSEYLREFGLWDEIEPHACPVGVLELSYRAGHKFAVSAAELGLPALGWTIPHRKLQQILWQRVHKYAAENELLDVSQQFTMEDLAIAQYPALIKGKISGDNGTTEQELHSGAIFMAAGAAFLAQQPKLVNYHRYNTIEDCPRFTVASVKLATGGSAESGKGYWFYRGDAAGGAAGGTLALTPSAAASNEYTAILSRPAAAAPLDAASFGEAVTAISGMQVAQVLADPVVYPALSYLAEERVKGPLVLVGNAAHSVAPLGGQNYNLTLWTIRELKRRLESHLAAGGQWSQRQFLGDFITATESKLKRHLKIVHWLDKELEQLSEANAETTRWNSVTGTAGTAGVSGSGMKAAAEMRTSTAGASALPGTSTVGIGTETRAGMRKRIKALAGNKFLLDRALEFASSNQLIRRQIFLWATGINR